MTTIGGIDKEVSNQLGSPASGDVLRRVPARIHFVSVSNQLGSPASGDCPVVDLADLTNQRFQSIRVSSEWRPSSGVA